MKRFFMALIAALALTLALVLPASAGAKTGQVLWQCDLDGPAGEPPVTFVSAPAAAEHGITQANSTAGVVFHEQFGEDCTVVVVP